VVKLIIALLKAGRPRQWIKNLSVFVAIVFTGQLFNASMFRITVWSFVIFCTLSSATYLFNDIVDFKRDQLHPLKKHRPIASGLLPQWIAAIFLVLLLWWGLSSSLAIGPTFFLICLTYILLQLSYSLFLKHLAVLDILAIAAGYILRVLAGEFATGFHVTFWLLICVISVSLFLAIGKRKAELTSLMRFKENVRPVLVKYSDQLLDQYLSMFANSTWFSYALFTFLEPPIGPHNKMFYYLENIIPAGLTRKWLVITIPFVIYGLMRYTQLIYEKQEGEIPEKIILGDKPLLITSFIWMMLVVVLIYVVGR
jgi:4-hydroxybenzoate polyprenyltransferase